MWRSELGQRAQKMNSKEIQEEKWTDLTTELWGSNDWIDGEATHETTQEEEQWMTELGFCFCFLMFIYLFWERERGERQREKERERIPSRLLTVSAEPNTGLKLMNREIITWANIKSWSLNWLRHPGAPELFLTCWVYTYLWATQIVVFNKRPKIKI